MSKTKIKVPKVQSGGNGLLHYINEHVMILLNIGSKFIPIQFSKSAEEYLKLSVTKQILVFAMAWMGTRDIYASLVLTAVFVVLSDHLFNDESHLCIVPHKHRILHKIMDTNNDGVVSPEEETEAEKILEKAKKQKLEKQKRDALMQLDYNMVATQ